MIRKLPAFRSVLNLCRACRLVSCLLFAVGTGVASAAMDHVHEPDQAANVDPHAHHKVVLENEQLAGAVELVLHDVEMLDQNNVRLKFKSDVIGENLVAMSFIYTTCTTVCPVISAIFAQVQSDVGSRLGNDVTLVSITVDPIRDVPRRLKTYAERLKVKPGWLWLTGQKQVVDKVLQGLGAYTPAFEDHPAMVLVGDGRSGEWYRFYGFPGANQITDKLEEFTKRRASLSMHSGHTR